MIRVAILCLILSGCMTTRTESVSMEKTTGTQGGHPVNLTTVRKDSTQAESSVDIGPAVQAAVAAAMGDFRGAVSSLAAAVNTMGQRPAPPTIQEMKAALSQGGLDATTTGTLAGAAGLAALALREFLAHRRTQKDADEAWQKLTEKET